jgi:protein-tyrosine sulfotransferase
MVTQVPANPVFLLSHFRSGSTVLRYVLDAHPAFCCPAELRLGALCETLYGVIELTTGERDDRAWQPAGIARVRAVVDDLMRSYCERKGKSRWCDKSPGNMEFVGTITTVFPDAQFIALHRRALDQVWSSYEVHLHAAESTPGKPKSEIWTELLERWCIVTERLLALEQYMPHAVHRMTYERLTAAPEAEAARMCEFLHVQRVSGLTETAFAIPHDPGPADVKIRGSKGIDSGRVGKGRRVEIAAVPARIRARLDALMAEVGYWAGDCNPHISEPSIGRRNTM